MIRLFVPGDLQAGRAVALTAAQAHYLTAVMRLAAGGEVAAFNGRDGEWRTHLARTSSRVWSLVPLALSRPQAPTPDLDLLIALIRRPRLETAVEKAAELGARRVRLLITERTNPGRANLDRLAAIAAEAAEQTGRIDVPAIGPPARLVDVLEAWEGDRRLLFCDEAGEALPILEALKAAPPRRPWALLIGPEGGFSPAERALVRAAPFAVPVGLGPRVLRADTAAIAAMALWQSALGDWRGLEVRPPPAHLQSGPSSARG